MPFILATGFTVLNLFIGVIVDAMQSQHATEFEEERIAQHADSVAVLREVQAVRAELASLRREISTGAAPRPGAGTSTGPQGSNV